MMELQYVMHFDELTWMPGVLDRPFNRVKGLDFYSRPVILRWLADNCRGKVVVWGGCVSPQLGQNNWGFLVSPDEETSWLIFMEDEDQTRFALEFVGNNSAINAKIYRDGLAAFHARQVV